MLHGGVYRDLVNAQQLEPLVGSEEPSAVDTVISQKEEILHPEEYPADEQEEGSVKKTKTKSRGFMRSLGIILSEHRKYWFLFLVVIICAIGGGCKCPLFSWDPRAIAS